MQIGVGRRRIRTVKYAISKATTVGIVVIIIVIIAAAGFYGLTLSKSSSNSSTSTSSVPSTLVIDDAAWPQNGVNALLGSWPTWWDYTVYQPLIYTNDSLLYRNGTVQYVPSLAQNWTISSDGTVYTLNLRNGVKFSDGNPLTAYSVWFQYYTAYYLSGNSSNFLDNYAVLYDNLGTANFGSATITLVNQSGLINPSQQVLRIMMNSSWPIYITGKYQIVFHLKAPFPYFPSIILAQNPILPFDMQWVLDHGGVGTPASPNTYFDTHSIPGTGPYMVSAVSPNAYVSFTQNPYYWGKNLSAAEITSDPLLSPGQVKNVIIYFKSDDVARYTDLVTGTAQISAIESTDWPLITSSPAKFSYVSLPPWAQFAFGIALNTKLYPTNITAVRQAIVHAINYTDFNQKVAFGTLTQFVGPTFPAYSNLYDLGGYKPYTYNLTLAKQYLKQANIANFPTITIRIISGCTFCSDGAQVIQYDLSQLNISATIQELSSTDYYAPYGSYATNVANAAQLGQISFIGGQTWGPGALTPYDNWVWWMSNSSTWGDWAAYSAPSVQACIDSFFNGTSTANMAAICSQAQAQIYNDAPYVYFSVGLWWIDGSLVWLKSGPINSFDLDPLFTGANTAPIFQTVTFK
jgi:ABC-type transport system substrate-binding protein